MRGKHLEPGKAIHRFSSPDFGQNEHCPFGCTRDTGECDIRGFCEHFIGITLEGNEVFHRMRNLRYVNKEEQEVEMSQDALDGNVEYVVNKTHKLVPITRSCRVYHADGADSFNKTEIRERKPKAKKKPELAVS